MQSSISRFISASLFTYTFTIPLYRPLLSPLQFKHEKLKRTHKGLSTMWIINTITEDISVEMSNPVDTLPIKFDKVASMNHSRYAHLHQQTFVKLRCSVVLCDVV